MIYKRRKKSCNDKNKISSFHSFLAIFIPRGRIVELPFIPPLYGSSLCKLCERILQDRDILSRWWGMGGLEVAVSIPALTWFHSNCS
jgi:hypothetical protein